VTQDLSTVLIANRGEIAVRIARTLRELGIRSVAVFTAPDRGAPHTEACDEAVEIPSYLDAAALVTAAKKSRAAGIHPGYGYLSQNATFVAACAKARITFIGPSAKSMRLMGDKESSRATAQKAGVPVVPGSGAMERTQDVVAAAKKIGLPVMIKAAAGGGGKGMRRIEKDNGLESEIDSARREAESAFGDGRLLVEKLVVPSRHIEVQVVGDSHGTVVALGERECSLQRRFQKIIEEAPAVDPVLRAKLEEAACALARAAGYESAGTVEFLLRPDGTFLFLEMNTRLQVEHPVTELVRGVDLVQLQIEVARGKKISANGPIRGHAIEARIYAENPDAGFLPAGGRILRMTWPEDVRVDHALREGLEITPDFDPLIAKVIAWGENREEARAKLVAALRRTVLLGVVTNINFLVALLETPEVMRREMVTDRLPEIREQELPLEVWATAVASKAASAPRKRRPGPWETLGRWRVGE
jgi:acetyl-CoA/propionyl-CoA carboxylase biotin carboxyl carrier protein